MLDMSTLSESRRSSISSLFHSASSASLMRSMSHTESCSAPTSDSENAPPDRDRSRGGGNGGGHLKTRSGLPLPGLPGLALARTGSNVAAKAAADTLHRRRTEIRRAVHKSVRKKNSRVPVLVYAVQQMAVPMFARQILAASAIAATTSTDTNAGARTQTQAVSGPSNVAAKISGSDGATHAPCGRSLTTTTSTGAISAIASEGTVRERRGHLRPSESSSFKKKVSWATANKDSLDNM